MNVAFMELIIRRRKKARHLGASESFVHCHSLENDVTTATLHQDWWAETGRDSGAMSALAFEGRRMKRCHTVVGAQSRKGKDHAESTEKQTTGQVWEIRGFRNPEA